MGEGVPGPLAQGPGGQSVSVLGPQPAWRRSFNQTPDERPLLFLFPSLNLRLIQAAPPPLPHTKRSREEEGGLVAAESQNLLSFVCVRMGEGRGGSWGI